jgi:hypothetical protein
MLVVNALMVVATPIVGVHYLVDVIGGLAVGGVAVLAAGRLRRTMFRLRAVRKREVGHGRARPRPRNYRGRCDIIDAPIRSCRFRAVVADGARGTEIEPCEAASS